MAMEINRFQTEAMPHIRALIELNNGIKSRIYENTTLSNNRSNQLYLPTGRVDQILDKILVSQDIKIDDVDSLMKQQVHFREILDRQASNAWRIRVRKTARLKNISDMKDLSVEFYTIINKLSILVKSDQAPKNDVEISQIPKQIPAPIRAKIVNERLVADNEKHKIGSLTDSSIEKAFQSISNTLQVALDLLSDESNCDKRVAPSCRPLLESIDVDFKEISIINVGYNARILSKILLDFSDQIPDVILMQLEHVSRSLNILVNQFEEWRLYVGVEFVTEVSPIEIENIISNSEALAADLSKNPELVDPQIPLRINQILAPASDGIIRSEAIISPLVGSLSNIFSQLSHVALDSAPWIAEKTQMVIHISEKGAHNPLLILALAALAKYSPNLANIGPFRFLSSSYEIAIKHFPWAKDTILK